MKRCIQSVFLVMVLLLCPYSAAYGNDEPSDKSQISAVKLAIDKSFQDSQKALDADKQNWGLSENESFSQAVLGEGIPYYDFSPEFLAGKDSKDILIMSGYIFPITIANKPVGIVNVKQIDGQWQIFNIGNINTFEQDIKEANQRINNPTLKLVWGFKLRALFIPKASGYDILPLQDNESYGLKKYEIKGLENISDFIVEEAKAANSQTEEAVYGGNTTSNGKSVTNTRLIILWIILLTVATGIYVRYRRAL
ncbi:MAG TPA: hypothetical protein DER33_01715 [Syntrophomonas sp.]|nr:hypothetical protein [Syntrophomonas sp.]